MRMHTILHFQFVNPHANHSLTFTPNSPPAELPAAPHPKHTSTPTYLPTDTSRQLKLKLILNCYFNQRSTLFLIFFSNAYLNTGELLI